MDTPKGGEAPRGAGSRAETAWQRGEGTAEKEGGHLQESGPAHSLLSLLPTKSTVSVLATTTKWPRRVWWRYTRHVHFASKFGWKPDGKYTAKGPSGESPSAGSVAISCAGCIVTADGMSLVRFLLPMTALKHPFNRKFVLFPGRVSALFTAA